VLECQKIYKHLTINCYTRNSGGRRAVNMLFLQGTNKKAIAIQRWL